jgi:hypothetical protein
LNRLRVMGPEATVREPASAKAAPFGMHLHLERGGDAVSIEPVTRSDLVDPLAEVWLDADLRRGFAEVRLDQVRARVSPVHRNDPEIGRYCAGFDLEVRDPEGKPFRRFFPRESLDHVASRGARRLIEDGRLDSGALYYFGLGPADGGSPWSEGVTPVLPPIAGPPGRSAPGTLRVPLARLRERARHVGPASDDHYPVFFTRAAHERAERVARKGGDAQPPVETGGLYVGPLCVCPDTLELFAVVVDVLEATQAEATKYSLTYSGPTWARIQAILRARRGRRASRHDRVLGQGHGHNFLPLEGAEPCEACAHVAVCTRTSAYLSLDDRTWCRAVFPGEPWQVSQVFGLDARSRPVDAFYGQRGGTLVRRGYSVIDDFDDSLLDE